VASIKAARDELATLKAQNDDCVGSATCVEIHRQYCLAAENFGEAPTDCPVNPWDEPYTDPPVP